MADTLFFILPGPITARTGGSLYDRHMVDGMRAVGREVVVLELSDRFPFPDVAALADAEQAFAGLPPGAVAVIDGLAFGALPDLAARHRTRLRLIALVHHPLALETGLSDAERRHLDGAERRALTAARGAVTTSAHTADLVAGLGVPPARIETVVPGTDTAPLARGSGAAAPVILSVGSLTPRKGHDVLIQALAALADLPWRAVIAGSAEATPNHARDLRDLSDRHGLGRRITFTGAVDGPGLDRLYDGADLFVLATRYEGFGMVLTEAIARGLPVVTTRTGAVPDTLAGTGAVLVPPDDPGALAAALAPILTTPGRRQDLARAARAARQALPDWPRQAARFSAAIDRLAGHG